MRGGKSLFNRFAKGNHYFYPCAAGARKKGLSGVRFFWARIGKMNVPLPLIQDDPLLRILDDPLLRILHDPLLRNLDDPLLRILDDPLSELCMTPDLD